MADPQIPSSFIPKKQESSGAFTSHRGGFFSFLANLIFIVSIVATVGVFVYGKYLEGQISKMDSSLSEAREALQPNLIKELSRSDKRLIAAESLIASHITLSSFFELLQSLTLQNVRFNSFEFTTSPSGQLSVSLEGEAVSYATVAYQAQVINENDNFVKPQFSDLDLNENGDVTFSFESGVSQKAVSYVEQLRAFGPLETPSTPPVSGSVDTVPASPETSGATGGSPQATQPN